jgi:hypothetical protein
MAGNESGARTKLLNVAGRAQDVVMIGSIPCRLASKVHVDGQRVTHKVVRLNDETKGEIDVGDGTMLRPTYVNANLSAVEKEEVHALLKQFVGCFAWEYTEMLGLDRGLVEHHLPIKMGFHPHKQPARSFRPNIVDQIKENIDRLLKANFFAAMQVCRVGVKHSPCREQEYRKNMSVHRLPGSKQGYAKRRVSNASGRRVSEQRIGQQGHKLHGWQHGV